MSNPIAETVALIEATMVRVPEKVACGTEIAGIAHLCGDCYERNMMTGDGRQGCRNEYVPNPDHERLVRARDAGTVACNHDNSFFTGTVFGEATNSKCPDCGAMWLYGDDDWPVGRIPIDPDAIPRADLYGVGYTGMVLRAQAEEICFTVEYYAGRWSLASTETNAIWYGSTFVDAYRQALEAM